MKATFNNATSELAKLISINSVETAALPNMPFGKGNADALACALNLLEEFGFKTANIDNYCGWGEIGDGELFGILCHLDVVPVSPTWTKKPFNAEIIDNKLYGRGALDDKGPFIASLFATAKLLQEGRTPKKRIRFILGCDEESGWLCMDRYKQTEELPNIGFSPDADFPVINCEKGLLQHTLTAQMPLGVYNISGGSRSNIVPNFAEATLDYDKLVASLAKAAGLNVIVDGDKMTIVSRGTSVHASNPASGENAITKLFGALGIKYPLFNKLYAGLNDTTGLGVDLAISDDISGDLTLNLGTANSAEKELIMLLDIRYPISFEKDDITATLKAELPDIKVEQSFYHLPHYVDPENELVTALLAAYNKVMKTQCAPITIGGGTYARVLPLGVAFGPVFPNTVSTIHMDDEYVDLDDFAKTIEIYYEAIGALCF